MQRQRERAHGSYPETPSLIIKMNTKGTSSSEHRQEPPNDGSGQTPLSNTGSLLLNKQSLFEQKGQFGTFDTLIITQSMFTPDRIKNLDSWNVVSRNGQVTNAYTVIYVNSDGSHSQYGIPGECSTIGLRYRPPAGSSSLGSGVEAFEDLRNNCYLVVTISSPAAILHGRNTMRVMTPEEIPILQDAICNILSDYVDSDPMGMLCTRIDSASRYNTDTPTAVIIDTLHSYSRHRIGHSKQTFHQSETIKYGNKSTSFGIYDSAKKYNLWQSPLDPNFTRVESQAIGSASVTSMYGVGQQAKKGKYQRLEFKDIGHPEVIAQAAIRRLHDFDRYFPFPKNVDDAIKNEKKVKDIFNAQWEYWTRQEEIRKETNPRGFNDLEARIMVGFLAKLGITKSDWDLYATDYGFDASRKSRLMSRLDDYLMHPVIIKDIHQEIRNHIENDLKLIA